MTAPRQILPGKTYLITRRCSQRNYFLRPSAQINATCIFCLAYAAEMYGIQIHAFCFMSNHYHLVLTDPECRLPEFQQWLNEFLAKSVNAALGRWENLWAPGSYSAVTLGGVEELESAEDVLDKIVYTLTNPVAAGLVKFSHQWPGLLSSPHRIGGDGKTTGRPQGFFRRSGAVAESAELKLVVPPAFGDMSVDEFRALLVTKIKDKERSIHLEFEAKGKTFMGAKKVLAQSPFGRPETRALQRRLNPRIACRDKARREKLIQQLKDFLVDYRTAWEAFCQGVRDVVFPAGTYKHRVLYGVACENPP